MKTTLYRTKGPPWEFTPNSKYGRLCHITRNGTVYGILMSDVRENYNVWIGRFFNKLGWFPRERELRAKFIRFSDGGKYEFPE